MSYFRILFTTFQTLLGANLYVLFGMFFAFGTLIYFLQERR